MINRNFPKQSISEVHKQIFLLYFARYKPMITSLILKFCGFLTQRSWCWKRLRAGGEGDDRGWDGWMASLTQWTWVLINSRVLDGQGGLACCGSQGRKESDMTERRDWTNVVREGENYKVGNICNHFTFNKKIILKLFVVSERLYIGEHNAHLNVIFFL